MKFSHCGIVFVLKSWTLWSSFCLIYQTLADQEVVNDFTESTSTSTENYLAASEDLQGQINRLKTLHLRDNFKIERFESQIEALEVLRKADKLKIQRLEMKTQVLEDGFQNLKQTAEIPTVRRVYANATWQSLSDAVEKNREDLELVKRIAKSYTMSTRVRFYSGANRTGLTKDYNVNPTYYGQGCYNLKELKDNVSSINTFNSCARLFTEENCTGTVDRVYPGYEYVSIHPVRSVGPCVEEPYGRKSLEYLSIILIDVLDALMTVKKTAASYAQTTRVRFYSGANLTGSTEEYNVNPTYYGEGCYNLKELQGNVTSLNTYNTCARLFSEKNCVGSMDRVYPGREMTLTTVGSVGPCFEEPHGSKSIYRLRSNLGENPAAG